MLFQLLDAEFIKAIEEAISVLNHGLDHVVDLEALLWAIAFLKDHVIRVQELEHSQQPLLLVLSLLDVGNQSEPPVLFLLTSVVVIALDDLRDSVDQVLTGGWVEAAEVGEL